MRKQLNEEYTIEIIHKISIVSYKEPPFPKTKKNPIVSYNFLYGCTFVGCFFSGRFILNDKILSAYNRLITRKDSFRRILYFIPSRCLDYMRRIYETKDSCISLSELSPDCCLLCIGESGKGYKGHRMVNIESDEILMWRTYV